MPYMFFEGFLSNFFFDILGFFAGRKKIIKRGNFTTRENRVNLCYSFKFQSKYNIFCSTFTGLNTHSFFDVFYSVRHISVQHTILL